VTTLRRTSSSPPSYPPHSPSTAPSWQQPYLILSAITVSVYVVRAFIKLRDMLSTQKDFARKLEELEKELVAHDEKFTIVFKAIRQLMRPAVSRSKRRIGFSTSEESSS